MRDLIISRILDIKRQEQGFPENSLRWAKLKHNNLHGSEVDPSSLSDMELMIFYERIIRNYFNRLT